MWEEYMHVQPSIQNTFVLSHLNHKSSVLCPKNRSITEQYLALEQLDAHQKKIAKAKGHVDTSAPKSLQSYISSIENARRNKKTSVYNARILSSLNESEIKSGIMSPPVDIEEDKPVEQVSGSPPSSTGNALDKGIQTSSILSTMNSKVADKISWYLEAVSQGELDAHAGSSRSFHEVHPHFSRSHDSTSSGLAQHKVMKGDVMEWDHDKFKHSKRPFSPRVLVNNSAKSKVLDMRCYNSPSKKIQKSSNFRKISHKLENSSDMSSSMNNPTYSEWINDQAWRVQIRQKLKSKLSKSTLAHTAEPEPFSESRTSRHFGCRSSLEVLSLDEESTYLKYLSEVTEDILRSGVYTDRAIKRAFEFHLQFHNKEADRDKLLQLLEQVLEDLSIEDGDDHFKRSVVPPSLKDSTICNSPPEKETLDKCERDLVLPSGSLSSKMASADLVSDLSLMENKESNGFSNDSYNNHDTPCTDVNELERHKSTLTQMYPSSLNQYGVS